MRYSLSSRFRGTLLGTLAGQSYKKLSCDGEHLLFPGLRSLVQLGKFDVGDWCNAFGKPTKPLPGEAVITCLPLALFCHENEINLRKNLQLLGPGWENDLATRDGTLAVSYVITQCLTERLNAATLIPKTVAFLGNLHTPLSQQLLMIQAMLEQHAGTERVHAELVGSDPSTIPISMAFYYFLSTLEDLRLSVLRAAQTGYQQKTTAAITGALSGAYNSAAGVPADLQVMLFQSHCQIVAEVIGLSESLFVVWSGLYDRTPNPKEMTATVAIAAPQVIRI